MFDPVAEKEIYELRNKILRIEYILDGMLILLSDTLPPAYAEDLAQLFVPQKGSDDGN